MAKLLHEDEYNELTADRERLEWLQANDGRWDNVNGILSHGWSHVYAANLREAIDKARGVK